MSHKAHTSHFWWISDLRCLIINFSNCYDPWKEIIKLFSFSRYLLACVCAQKIVGKLCVSNQMKSVRRLNYSISDFSFAEFCEWLRRRRVKRILKLIVESGNCLLLCVDVLHSPYLGRAAVCTSWTMCQNIPRKSTYLWKGFNSCFLTVTETWTCVNVLFRCQFVGNI